VTPLHKKDYVNDPKNDRPVSVISGVALIFERVMDGRFDRSVPEHILESKFGFLRGCGTNC
jgi:hypothetical protein